MTRIKFQHEGTQNVEVIFKSRQIGPNRYKRSWSLLDGQGPWCTGHAQPPPRTTSRDHKYIAESVSQVQVQVMHLSMCCPTPTPGRSRANRGDLTVPQVKFPMVGKDSVFKSPNSPRSTHGPPKQLHTSKNYWNCSYQG